MWDQAAQYRQTQHSCSVTLFTQEVPCSPTVPTAGRGSGGSGVSSLARVVDLDLLVDGGQHVPHPGLQPTQLGRLGIQHPLVALVRLLQRCRDEMGTHNEPRAPPPSPPPPAAHSFTSQPLQLALRILQQPRGLVPQALCPAACLPRALCTVLHQLLCRAVPVPQRPLQHLRMVGMVNGTPASPPAVSPQCSPTCLASPARSRAALAASCARVAARLLFARFTFRASICPSSAPI